MDWSDQAVLWPKGKSLRGGGGGVLSCFSVTVLLMYTWLYRCALSCNLSSYWLVLAGCAGKTLFILISRCHKIAFGSDKYCGITDHWSWIYPLFTAFIESLSCVLFYSQCSLNFLFSSLVHMEGCLFMVHLLCYIRQTHTHINIQRQMVLFLHLPLAQCHHHHHHSSTKCRDSIELLCCIHPPVEYLSYI